MSNYPSLNAKKVIKILKKLGYEHDSTNGSHRYFIKDGCVTIPVPFHGAKDLAKGTLYGIIDDTGETKEKFFGLS